MVTTNPAAYDDFAWIYDRHWGRDAAWMLDAIAPLVLRGVPAPARVLDLCCGTGQMARALHDRGYDVTGVDGSAEMVRYARRNAPGCTFVVADARDFAVPGPYDLALSLYDSLNHLLQPDDLRRAFACVHAALRPGAPFLFDLNMADGFRARWRGSFGVAEDEYACIVRSRFDEPDASAELAATIFRRGEAEWARSDVVLHQRCYTEDEVRAALAAEGFSGVRVFDAARDLGLTKQVGRGFFLATA
ncbi:class I SAM-dependent methyltransferase [Longimicrobium sp.]|uniref:class I SAM-dependent DNA methyltransferase n=1 Tax=Longimicrobium sp. TaxID=2029185 RepID=UPI002E31D09C|nr:class I SAM-dependent methyltransferase [Longimicrobium sp.]HEX6040189.1 class I SAM-dependent methyltransferase [Longimicrobium sp.]